MIKFERKKISQKSIGEILKEKRKEKSLSLEEVKEKTKIPLRHLTALENNDYDFFEGEIYFLNFLKRYSLFLNLDFEFFKKKFQEEQKILFKKTPPKEKKVAWHHFLVPSRFLLNILFIFVILFFVSFLGFKIKKIFTPPEIVILSPEDNLVTFKNWIIIKGKTEKETEVVINDQKIFSDENGYFEKIINLQKGLNIIKITASKKYSQKKVVYKKIFLKE